MNYIPFSIEHSGQVWTCLGYTESGVPIWPIEEFIARTRMSKKLEKKLSKLNPHGKPEGERPNGWPTHKVMHDRSK